MVQADTTSMAMGVADAGASIGRGMENMAARMKRQQDEDKDRADKAKKIRGMAKMFSEDLGLSDSEVQSKDAEELAGMVEGFMLENSSRHQKLKQEHEALAIAALKRQAETEAASRSVPGLMMEDIEGAGQGIPSPLSNEAFDAELTERTGLPPFVRNFIQAHARAGAPLPPNAIDDILRQTGAAGRRKVPEAGTIGGRNVIYSPDTGAFQVMPDDITEADFYKDPNTGEPIPGVINVGGKPVRVPVPKPEATGELQPVLDPITKKPVPGMGMDAEGKVHDFRSMLQKARGDGAPASGPASEPAAAPASSKRVTVQKDGKLFTLPEAQLDEAKKQGYTLVK